VDNDTGTVVYVSVNATTGTERWALMSSPDALNVSSDKALTESGYYHQFTLDYSYSLGGLAGETSPSPPILLYSAFGLHINTKAPLTIVPTAYWCDNGGSWRVVPALLWDSDLSERFCTCTDAFFVHFQYGQ
jgi:hypothetical protein